MQASYKQDTRNIREVPLKDSHTTKETPQYEEELKRCIELLKINHDNQIAKAAFELIKKSNDQQHGGWIL
jgi:hypothetical protein